MKLSKYLTAGFAAAGLLAFTQPLQAQPDLDNMFLEEDTDLFDPGLPIGAQFPAIRASYKGQEINNIEQFFGDKGTVFFAVRSVDWWPYCRAQLGQLQDYVEVYKEAGVSIVVATYDTPETQQAFVDAGNITYPFISDIDTTTMAALAILNEKYGPDELAYGVPHPGVFVVNLDNEIVGKIFIDSYRERVDGEGTLRYALDVLE